MSTVYCLHTCWHIISIVLYEQQTTLFVSSSCMCVQSALCQIRPGCPRSDHRTSQVAMKLVQIERFML